MSTTIQEQMDLAKRPPGGVAELLVIALPMVISQACETLMMFTDRVMLSRLGPEYMSAAMGGGLTCFMFMTFLMGLTGYATALVAQHLGAGQEKRCAVAAMQGVWISLAAWPLMLACIPLGLWIFRSSSIAPEQMHLQETFFRYMIVGSGIGLLRNALASFFSGVGRTRIVMASSMVALVVNLAANYILIYGKFGFPALGIRGSAIGTILGGTCALGVLIAWYLAPSVRERFGVREGFRLDRELMKKLIRFGSPSGAEFLLNIAAFNLIVLTYHSYGLVEATAMTITFNWDLVSFIPLVGVGIAVTSLVGRYMGAGSPDIAQRAAMSGVKVAAMYTCLTFTTFCLFPHAMVEVFRPAGSTAVFDQIAVLATFMVRVMVLYLFADAMAIVFSSALRGAGDTFWTMVISVTGHWLTATAAMVMVRYAGVGPRVSWCLVVAFVFTLATSFYLRFRSGAWRKMKVLETPVPVVDAGEVTESVAQQ